MDNILEFVKNNVEFTTVIKENTIFWYYSLLWEYFLRFWAIFFFYSFAVIYPKFKGVQHKPTLDLDSAYQNTLKKKIDLD